MKTLDFEILFEEQLRVRGLILPGDKVYVACSGGPDSVALAHLLSGLSKKWNLKLGLIHLNHGLRGKSSDADQKFVQKLAEKLQIPFLFEKVNLKKIMKKRTSLEEAAREVRYTFFKTKSKKHRIPKIALAHNMTDQAETILMRVIQGTGMQGLLGIRERRREGRLEFIRPLIHFEKKDILEFLEKNKIKYRIDKSNSSEKMLRNRIRHKLIPLLKKEFNPKVIQAAARIPSILADDAEILQRLEKEAYAGVIRSVRKNKIKLKKDVFLSLETSLQFRILARVLSRMDSKSGMGHDHWKKLKAQLSRPRYRHSLPRDIDIVLTPSEVMLYKKKNVR